MVVRIGKALREYAEVGLASVGLKFEAELWKSVVPSLRSSFQTNGVMCFWAKFSTFFLSLLLVQHRGLFSPPRDTKTPMASVGSCARARRSTN